jgi:anaerobic magnesium-protoporphyrin IX monomethyl ester cyclase
MRVLLVNPPKFEGVSVIREERCEITERYSVLEPYSLLQVGALLRQKGHEVQLQDLNGFDLPYSDLTEKVKGFRPDLVIFRFTPTTFDHDLRTASAVKEVDSGIGTAGICWTLRTLPRSVMDQGPDLDYYIRQDYEVVAPALVDALADDRGLATVPGIAFREGERIALTGNPEPLKDYDSLPLPAFDLLPSLDPYFVTAPAGKPFTILYTSKGCPFKCSFCTVAGTPWRPKSAARTVEELRYLKQHYHLRTASFFDETFTLDKKRVLALCEALTEEQLGINWYCNTRAHLVDRDLLTRMSKAGCRGISYGIESGSQKILDTADKCIKVDQARQAVLWAKGAGIKTFCSFIFGLPGEDWTSVNDTIEFVRQTLPTSAQFNVAVPYPGTRFYESVYGTMEDQALDFRHLYQDKAVIGTEAMTPEELNQARKKAYRSLYANPRWWLSNLGHVMKHREDFELAARYALKIANNYLLHGMEDAH